MPVNAVGAPLSAGTQPNAVASHLPSPPPSVGYNEFLQLLIAELQNQDPTSPTDPTQYLSQLASFSSVAQQAQTNAMLDSLLSVQAANLIGKTLTAADGVTNGIVVSVTITADGGTIAALQDGTQIELGPGVTISAT
ncbi:MAG TPA: flagellar hook assembly protein FlgD [Methylocella sp.]|nr:flagellar hook assembly protein FlgD [Methylocella sp.]